MRAIFGALVVTVAIVLLSREAMPQRKISPDIMAMLRRFVEQLKESKGTHSLPPGFIFPEELTVKTAATPTTESPTQKPVQGKSGEQISKPTGDYCDEQTQETFQEFCQTLEDGYFMDPWDPFCGYIQCLNRNATRHCCEKGTWTGQKGLSAGRQALCRRPLKMLEGPKPLCPVPTSNPKMCDKAEWVVTYNKMHF